MTHEQRTTREAQRVARLAIRHDDIEILEEAAVVAAALVREQLRLHTILGAIRSQAVNMLVALETLGEDMIFPLDGSLVASAQRQTAIYTEKRAQLRVLLYLMNRSDEFDTFLVDPWKSLQVAREALNRPPTTIATEETRP